MRTPSSQAPPSSEQRDVPDAVRVQILATEHWSLLATRTMTWNEMFTRAGMFLTVLLAATVALALMAQATGYGDDFRVFALLVLPVVLFIGLATYARLTVAAEVDAMTVIGMNRLRHAYLELAPELEPYFVTGWHDDAAGIALTYGTPRPIRLSSIVASTPAFVGIIDAVVAGVIVGLIADALDVPVLVYIALGVLTAVTMLVVLLGMVPRRTIGRFMRSYQPGFPSPPSDDR
jgi:hypothetical protein